MTEDEKNKIKEYKDYPEGSGKKGIYDYVFLPFQDYLNKYYKNPEITREISWKKWQRWQNKYIEPAYDTNRHEEMIKNFGYTSSEFYDFDVQNKVYEQLKEDERLDNETQRFIGFLAGTGFFRKKNITVEEWFKIENWNNPEGKFEDWKGRPINEILSYPYGLNLLKVNFPLMPYWRR